MISEEISSNKTFNESTSKYFFLMSMERVGVGWELGFVGVGRGWGLGEGGNGGVGAVGRGGNGGVGRGWGSWGLGEGGDWERVGMVGWGRWGEGGMVGWGEGGDRGGWERVGVVSRGVGGGEPEKLTGLLEISQCEVVNARRTHRSLSETQKQAFPSACVCERGRERLPHSSLSV